MPEESGSLPLAEPAAADCPGHPDPGDRCALAALVEELVLRLPAVPQAVELALRLRAAEPAAEHFLADHDWAGLDGHYVLADSHWPADLAPQAVELALRLEAAAPLAARSLVDRGWGGPDGHCVPADSHLQAESESQPEAAERLAARLAVCCRADRDWAGLHGRQSVLDPR